ncbi:hypothetical protein BDY19DRAFT_993402 [Irpex rosettiformis]|uniref:Uncharacterized protein n=1 Tax=Irpex rosettiformis TaxID=378272 RepID=A0ACB8U4L6_9APHY|nr:hypothetical protein BDY19DRAFT_993402 [Irpex rosettiformis]
MPPKSTGKRKSDAQAVAGSSKKTRTEPPAAILVDSILADKQGWALPEEEDDVRQTLVMLAEYAHALKLELASAEAAKENSVAAAPKKTRAELEAAADKIRRSANSGICKMMVWKPSCKVGTAKFSYDGACIDPEVFGIIMGLSGPPTWKMKRLTIEEFEEHFGECVGKVRYDYLYITGKNVTVRYSEGEFKISGTYGKHDSSRLQGPE